MEIRNRCQHQKHRFRRTVAEENPLCESEGKTGEILPDFSGYELSGQHRPEYINVVIPPAIN